MKGQSYRDLMVWQKSMDLVVEVYHLAAMLPRDELYGLSSQIKRSAISIPSNIAEGARRPHRADQLRFYSIAYASGAELETQLEIAMRLKFFTAADAQRALELLDEIMRMLNRLIANR